MFYLKILIIYIIVWWVLFFMALPIGVNKTRNFVPGQDKGAPEKPKLWVKFFLVSIVSMFCTFLNILDK